MDQEPADPEEPDTYVPFRTEEDYRFLTFRPLYAEKATQDFACGINTRKAAQLGMKRAGSTHGVIW
jgi:hypothetical protein